MSKASSANELIIHGFLVDFVANAGLTEIFFHSSTLAGEFGDIDFNILDLVNGSKLRACRLLSDSSWFQSL